MMLWMSCDEGGDIVSYNEAHCAPSSNASSFQACD